MSGSANREYIWGNDFASGMSGSHRDYMETSVPLGALFIALGVSVWALQFARGIFDGWIWAVVIGNAWVGIGALLLFADIRVYQFGQSPVEQLMVDGDDPSS